MLRVDVGEVLFVPHGWWHCVINIPDGKDSGSDDIDPRVSIALTQNYVSSANLPDVVRFLKKNKSQISGCRDREDAVDADRFREVFIGKLKKALGEKEMEGVLERSERGWQCKAWEGEKTSVMALAKSKGGEDREGGEGQGGGVTGFCDSGVDCDDGDDGGGGGFSFRFGL